MTSVASLCALALTLLAISACNGTHAADAEPQWTSTASRLLQARAARTQVIVSAPAQIEIAQRLGLASRLRTADPAIELLWVDGDERVARELAAEAVPLWTVTAAGLEPFRIEGPLPEEQPEPFAARLRAVDATHLAVETAFPGPWELVVVTAAGTVVVPDDEHRRTALTSLLELLPLELPLRCRVRARESRRASEWLIVTR